MYCIAVNSFWLGVRLPYDVPKREGYLCKYERLPSGTSYAIKFRPQPIKSTVQRMFLFGCSSPRHFRKYWDCSRYTPCDNEDEEYLIYAWTKNVPSVEIPENVGFKLGRHTKSKYIVLQVYYSLSNEVDIMNEVQNSFDGDDDVVGGGGGDGEGIDMYLSLMWQKYLAGIYLFSSKEFKVLPSTQKYHIDIGCKYHGKRIAPFAYRCEANHDDGQVVSAYRIREGEWALIGKANPQDPQGFYPIADDDMIVIKPGDYLTSRCVYDAQNIDGTEEIHEKGKTEICNFYLMYYMLNKNIPPNQYNERCDTLMQNVIQVPLKTTSGIDTVTTQLVRSQTDITKNNTDLINIKISNTTVATTDMPNTTIYSVKSIQIHTTRSMTVKPKMVIEPSSIGPKPILIDGWTVYDDRANKSIGIICSVGLSDNGKVVALHRGSRHIVPDSFDDEHYYTDFEKPIPEDTVLHINPLTGNVMKSFGSNLFYLPHSLTIDHENNCWITDIGLHQVIKFSSSNTSTPSLILGVATIPGRDDNHFCKPTDVAVDMYGNFFVADGYCNSRIMKYNKNGKLIKKWRGVENYNSDLKDGQFTTPHSLSIDNKLHQLYVSDLRNGNIIKFDTAGNFLKVMKHIGSDESLFSISFNQDYGGIIYALSGFHKHNQSVGHILSTKTGKVLTTWTIKNICKPHGIIASKEDTVLYMAVDSVLLKFKITNSQNQVQNGANIILGDDKYSEIKIIKPIDEDKDVLPAIIVVTVLAIPVVLVIITMLLQHIILRLKRKNVSIIRMHKHNFWNSSNNEVLCYGCCITRKHYFDGSQGMDNFMTGSDEESDYDEEDLFTGKA